MHDPSKRWLAVAVLLALCGICRPFPAQGQTEAEVEILCKTPLEERGRQQLERLLGTYNLDPWVFTRTVRIESYVIPHSHPVLTLNTRYLDDDHHALSTFVHEQAHWFEAADERASASRRAIEDLRAMYPNPPVPEEVGTRSDRSTYLHLMINWLELDAMAELVGEQNARAVLAEKGHYEWIYERVLEDTDGIGRILARHDMLITPERGLTVPANEE